MSIYRPSLIVEDFGLEKRAALKTFLHLCTGEPCPTRYEPNHQNPRPWLVMQTKAVEVSGSSVLQPKLFLLLCPFASEPKIIHYTDQSGQKITTECVEVPENLFDTFPKDKDQQLRVPLATVALVEDVRRKPVFSDRSKPGYLERFTLWDEAKESFFKLWSQDRIEALYNKRLSVLRKPSNPQLAKIES